MTAVRESVAPLVSALCLVHCVGLALVGPALPVAMGVATTARWLEPSLWAISATACAAALARARARRRLALLWGLAVGAGVLGLGYDSEGLIRVSLGSILLVQVTLAIGRWRERAAACGPCLMCGDERRKS